MNRRTVIKSIVTGVALNTIVPWNMVLGGTRESHTAPQWHVISEPVITELPGTNEPYDRIPQIVIGLGHKAHNVLQQANTHDTGICFYSSTNTEGTLALREKLSNNIGTIERSILVVDSTDTLSLRDFEFWKEQFPPFACAAIFLWNESVDIGYKTALEANIKCVFYIESHGENMSESLSARLLLEGLCMQNRAVISLPYFDAINNIVFGGGSARFSTAQLPSTCDENTALTIDTLFNSLLTDRSTVALIWIQSEPEMLMDDFSWITAEIRRHIDHRVSVSVGVITNNNLTDMKCRYFTVALA